MKLKLLQSDITNVQVDAIVNAANTSLLGGGGVDGAIHRKGGLEILEACRKIRATQGKCLPAKYVIHTVGPVWNNGGKDKERLLANCYMNALRLALENDVKTIAFPNISTGIYKFPKELAAKIAVEAVKSFQQQQIDEVTFVCFDEENYDLYDKLLRIK